MTGEAGAFDENAARRAWERAVPALEARIAGAFEALCARAVLADASLDFRPRPGAWTPREVLEHVTLTDRFVGILARKIVEKSARRLAAGEPWPRHGPRFEHLEELGARAFRWRHPEHMTPRGGLSRSDLLERLDEDRGQCLALAVALPPGAGTLHAIRMSALPGDDRLDLYQYLALLALHAERHARQIDRALAGGGGGAEPRRA